jgi:hypothetical protein
MQAFPTLTATRSGHDTLLTESGHELDVVGDLLLLTERDWA